VSRLTFPLLETERSSRPSSIPAAIIQALMPCLTQIGMATVRMRRPLCHAALKGVTKPNVKNRTLVRREIGKE
jgi:hypothetical protein